MKLTEREKEVLEHVFEFTINSWDTAIHWMDDPKQVTQAQEEIVEFELIRLKLGVSGSLHPLVGNDIRR